MKLRQQLFVPVTLITALASAGIVNAAERLTVTVTHTLDQARPSETITIPWTEVNRALPGALLQKIAVKDASGKVLPYQVTNVAPQAKDPKNEGIAYGELIFQHDFKPGEKTATFTVEKTEALAPVFPSKVSARYIQERLDDFAWENDKVAHRTYGPALAAPALDGSGKEVLVTSGMDIWFKRVPYPIVDRWYNKGHDHYHDDEGEGMDMYNVGKSRGAGGVGIWDGKTLYTGVNYAGWKVIANGPVRAIFELSYDAWDAAGAKVSEVKRFTVDAGHYFDQIDSTFNFTGAQQLTAAIGLNKTPADKGQDAKVAPSTQPADRALLQWVEQKSNGAFGTAIIVPTAGEKDYAEDQFNSLITAKIVSGQPLRYYVGAGWTRGGDFAKREDWQKYVSAQAARVRAPISVSLAATK
jgi:pectinesterase